MKNKPLKCSDCGKFVSYADLESGKATRKMVCPEPEDWVTLCRKCSGLTLQDRRDFLKKPMAERRQILQKQVDEFLNKEREA